MFANLLKTNYVISNANFTTMLGSVSSPGLTHCSPDTISRGCSGRTPSFRAPVAGRRGLMVSSRLCRGSLIEPYPGLALLPEELRREGWEVLAQESPS